MIGTVSSFHHPGWLPSPRYEVGPVMSRGFVVTSTFSQSVSWGMVGYTRPGKHTKKLLKMAIEIVSFPIKNI